LRAAQEQSLRARRRRKHVESEGEPEIGLHFRRQQGQEAGQAAQVG